MFKKILVDISSIIISVFTLFPLFTKNNLFRLFTILSVLTIFIISWPYIKRIKDISFFKLLFVYTLAIIISLITGIKYSIDFFIHTGIFLSFIPAYIFYKRYGFKQMKIIIIIITVFLILSAIQTIEMLDVYSNYSRFLSKNTDKIDVYGLSGGYGLVYASVLAFFSYIILFFMSSQITVFQRILFLLSSIVLLMLIWKAGFFLALLLLILGSIILLFSFFGIKSSINILFFLIIMVGVLFLLRPLMEDYIMTKVKGTKYEAKVSQILSSDENFSINDGEFVERNERYKRDLQLLIDYPIIGCWDRLKTGKHSYILDSLAQYGLIFGYFFIYIILFVPYQIFKKSKGIAYSHSLVFVVVLFIFLLFNSITISIAPIIFLFFPYADYLLKERR